MGRERRGGGIGRVGRRGGGRRGREGDKGWVSLIPKGPMQ